ncbi:MAG: hypothetical protein ACK5EE_07620 [Ignavibacteria bacterium]
MKKLHTILIIFTSSLVMFLYGCEQQAIQTLPERSWTLTWSDDFEGPLGSSPYKYKWTYDIGV